VSDQLIIKVILFVVFFCCLGIALAIFVSNNIKKGGNLMDNRLLIQLEIAKLLEDKPFAILPNTIVEEIILKGQAAKTDREWVGWIKDNYELCISGDCSQNTCVYRFLSPTCKLWQERKRSIEL
jgi:hypothetical protein